MGRRRGPCLGVTSPQRTTSKTDRRFSGFPSRARKDQKISPVLLSVLQPAGCGDKLAESRAISALQQFDDVRYLGSAARRGSDRRGKPPSRRNPLRIPRGDGPWWPFADSFVDRRAARLRLRVGSRASANGFVGKGLVDPNVVPAYTLSR